MKKPKHHIFVCASFRVKGDPQGICHKKNSQGLLQYLEQELSDRGLTEVVVSSTGCLKVCETGPSMVIYPENWWYGKIEGESDIDEIIDALEDGKPAGAYMIS
ncbi:MAG: (2Fe-2S) ferredoxin domain-containing protein [Deltaproteobacteria bacterium]|nr:(2Fe-2S) ferredoxin domain-containing protein [Deltaproteobacteria bacterium]